MGARVTVARKGATASSSCLAARTTRSASRKERCAEEAVATGPLGALSHDELGVIVDGLANPLQPVVAVAFSSTCKGLRTPLWAALKVLQQRHEKAVAFCSKLYPRTSCAELCIETMVYPHGLAADDFVTLGMLLSAGSITRVKRLNLNQLQVYDTGMQSLCKGLGSGSVPSLHALSLLNNKLGLAAAEAFAAALCRGAMPQLERLWLHANPIGDEGVAALAPPLQALRSLKVLAMPGCSIGDKGLASLVADLGEDDFKALERLDLADNWITEAGASTLVSAVLSGTFQSLDTLVIVGNLGDEAEEENLKHQLGRMWAETVDSDFEEEGEEEEASTEEDEEGF